jgi:hypothetical protein
MRKFSCSIERVDSEVYMIVIGASLRAGKHGEKVVNEAL